MANHNPSPNSLNIYFGSNSLREYFNPDMQPPVPLVEIPRSLNPFYNNGVRIYAKMMTMLPAHNVKALPAIALLKEKTAPGKTTSIVEYSSGSTVISMSMIGRINHDVTETWAFLSNKTSRAKLRLMRFFGLKITLFGGPSQPEPYDSRGGIQAARQAAEENVNIANPNQYESDANWRAHYRWTGPQIMKQLPQICVVCSGIGTSGTMTGLGTFFGEAKPSVIRIGLVTRRFDGFKYTHHDRRVCAAAGDRIPGPRTLALLSPVKFPWREAVDLIEEVTSPEAFKLSMDLSREGLICGPSSGLALKGLLQYLEKRRADGTLNQLAGASEDAFVHCVFLCCDLPYQYIDEYFEKLGNENFPLIENERLTTVDLHRYDEYWERDCSNILEEHFSFRANQNTLECPLECSCNATHIGEQTPSPGLKSPDILVLDLRTHADFSAWNLPGSRNYELNGYNGSSPSPFCDAALLENIWTQLEHGLLLGDESDIAECSICEPIVKVLVLCYNGDASRVATSVLRAKGVVADSFRGGVSTLRAKLEHYH